MRLFSIDYNSFSIAYSIFNEGDWYYSGILKNDGLVELVSEYGSMLEKLGITDIVIEDLYLGPNANSVKKLALVHGAIAYETGRRGVAYHEIYVSHWKSRMGLMKGAPKNKALQKKRAVEYANERLVDEALQHEENFAPDAFTDHNIADSYLIGVCWLEERGIRETMVEQPKLQEPDAELSSPSTQVAGKSQVS